MKTSIILLLSLFLQATNAFSAPSICPEISDYECLVKNSLKLYSADYKHWWKIYYYTANKALACKDPKNVTLFLRLWSGATDGEMAEGLSSDTEEIFTKKTSCFFEGFLGLPVRERKSFISNYCPESESVPIAKILKQAMKNPRYKYTASQLLNRVQGSECN